MCMARARSGGIYYWRVRVWDEFFDCPGDHTALSAIQSFTTGEPVATEKTNWGRLKAGYKNED